MCFLIDLSLAQSQWVTLQAKLNLMNMKFDELYSFLKDWPQTALDRHKWKEGRESFPYSEAQVATNNQLAGQLLASCWIVLISWKKSCSSSLACLYWPLGVTVFYSVPSQSRKQSLQLFLAFIDWLKWRFARANVLIILPGSHSVLVTVEYLFTP